MQRLPNFIHTNMCILKGAFCLSETGGQEKIRQGDGEVLRSAGETPQSVGEEERVAPPRGRMSFTVFLRRSHRRQSFRVYRLPSPSQADNQVDNVRQHFYEVSLEYVFKVQEVQERKMFDFVEPVSAFFKRSCSFVPFLFHRPHPCKLPLPVFTPSVSLLVSVSDPSSCWRFSRACSPTITTAMSWQKTSTTSRLSWPSAFRM